MKKTIQKSLVSIVLTLFFTLNLHAETNYQVFKDRFEPVPIGSAEFNLPKDFIQGDFNASCFRESDPNSNRSLIFQLRLNETPPAGDRPSVTIIDRLQNKVLANDVTFNGLRKQYTSGTIYGFQKSIDDLKSIKIGLKRAEITSSYVIEVPQSTAYASAGVSNGEPRAEAGVVYSSSYKRQYKTRLAGYYARIEYCRTNLANFCFADTVYYCLIEF